MKLASGHSARAVPEWIADHPDQAIPEKVQVRVFERYHGKCARSGARLYPGSWQCDHIIPLRDGGEHRESNLQPLAIKAHKAKTRDEARNRTKVNRQKRNHILPKPKSKWPSRPFAQIYFDNTKYIERDHDT